jgi:geranylgeranyl diphosphate synthase type I
MIDDLARQAVDALHRGQAESGWDAEACRVLEQLAAAATRRAH